MKTLPADVESRPASPVSSAAARWLYMKRVITHPFQMASVFPASRVLCERIAQQVRLEPGEWLVELGAGTGAVTQALLEHDAPSERTVAIEINPEMAQHLRGAFPGLKVVEGDAMKLKDLLPPGAAGKVGTVVCGLPMVLVPVETQRRVIDAMFDVMPEGRFFLQYSYCATSPLPLRKLGLRGKRVAFVPQSFPFASVWAYTRA